MCHGTAYGGPVVSVPTGADAVATRATEPAADGTKRRQVALGAVALAGVWLAVFGTGVVASLRMLAGAASPPAPTGWGDRVAALEWDVVAVGVVLVVVVRWLPRHAPDLARRMQLGRRLTRRVPGGLAGAAAVYVAVAVVSSWAGTALVAGLHLPGRAYPQLGGGTAGLLTTGAASLAAGWTEEVVLVALAAAVVQHACAPRSRWAVPATLALVVALRWLVHCYYGWTSLFVLVWAPGAYAVYRWAGSVWPLIAGHWAFDGLAAVQQAYPALTRAVEEARWVIAAAGVAVVLLSRRGTAAAFRPDSLRFRPISDPTGRKARRQ